MLLSFFFTDRPLFRLQAKLGAHSPELALEACPALLQLLAIPDSEKFTAKSTNVHKYKKLFSLYFSLTGQVLGLKCTHLQLHLLVFADDGFDALYEPRLVVGNQAHELLMSLREQQHHDSHFRLRDSGKMHVTGLKMETTLDIVHTRLEDAETFAVIARQFS